MDKQTVVYPHSGLLLNIDKEQTASTLNNRDESQNHPAKWKKPDTKGYTVLVNIYMTSGKAKSIGRGKSFLI